jgi:hypothetical protein
MKKSELQQLIKEEIDNVLNENQNLIINEDEEFDNRKNGFSGIFLRTYYDMSDHKLTFDEATDKLFAWIKANFK